MERPIQTPYKVKTGRLEDISKLVLGGAVFNTQYNENPYDLPTHELLKYAFDHGINAIDTSPYYGPSEEIIGSALKELESHHDISRDQFYICTKVGRIQLDDFDYSPEWIEKSVQRSLERLHTSYLDVVYLHDVEFVDEKSILEALKCLSGLKSKGTIKFVGISGYPVDFLLKMAKIAASEIAPLDTILSYSNMCLQNTRLLSAYNEFITEAKVTTVNNGSILSMSLLRSTFTHSFHPAPQDLKQSCKQLGSALMREDNMELADLATRFAIRHWIDKSGVTVLGCSSLKELSAAIHQFWLVKENVDGINESDRRLIEKSCQILGSHLNETWPSGNH